MVIRYSHSMVPMGTYTHSCTNGKAYTCTYSAPLPARPIDPVPMPPKGKMISRNLFLLYIISFTLSSRVRVCTQQL